MKANRFALLLASGFLVLALLGGSVAARVGPGEGSFRQTLLFSEVFSLVVDNYVDPVDPEGLLRGALGGMMAGLDAQGAYLSPQEAAGYRESPASGPADPGVSVVRGYGGLVVVSVFEGSPAAAEGLTAGDQIRRIDDRPLRDLSLPQALRLLRGEPGTRVKLDVLKIREGFQRARLELPRVLRTGAAHAVEARGGVTLLRVRDLSRVSPEAVAADLERAAGAGAGKLLVDVRNVADGSPRDAARLLGLFAAGDLLVLKDRSGKAVETVRSPGPGSAWRGSIAVLANAGSASGAEALAGILRERRGAVVYGESTYGLGAEPRLFDLPDGSALLLSATVWETAAGKTWHEDGVTPDRPLRSTAKREEVDEDILRKAIEDFAALEAEKAA